MPSLTSPTLTIFQALELPAYPHHSAWIGAPQNFQKHLPGVALPSDAPLLTLVQAIWDDWRKDQPLTRVELTEDDALTAQMTSTEIILIYQGHFSAAHRTYAPRLSEAENRLRYGKCANLHGHNYHVEVALSPQAHLPEHMWDEFDHVNLSDDIPDLRGRNVVTEAIAELIARRAPEARWVRVWELRDFFAEYHRADASYRLGRRYTAPGWLKIEVMVRGELDPRTETAYDLGRLDAHCLAVIQKLDYTSANSMMLTHELWTRLVDRLGPALTSLQVWETRQQRFCLSE